MHKYKYIQPTWITVLTLLIFCIVVQSVSAQTREFPPGLRWKQIETDHFIILFDEQIRETALKVAGMAEPIHQDVTELFQYAPSAKTYIVLTDHVDYSNGYATPLPQNKIVLFLREPGAGGPFFALGSPDWLALVLTHEYTHIVQIDMAKSLWGFIRKILGRVSFPNAGFPLWMIEGLAVYTETKWQNGRGYQPHYDMMIRTDILEDNFKQLDQMSAIGLRTWPMGMSYYLYGYFFYQYLADTYGEESVVELSLENSKKLPLISGNIFEKVYAGKKVGVLWYDWRDAMRARYEQQIEEIRSEPVTETRPLSKTGYFTTSPVFSPDGQFVYYIEMGRENSSPTLVRFNLENKTKTSLLQDISGNFTLSKDGQKIYFCKTDFYHTFSAFSDLYVLDINTKKVRRLTKGQRAFDPAIAPDGKTLVFTTTEAGHMSLMRMNLEDDTITPLLARSDHTQFAHPVFSPDGRRLALQIWQEGGFQDIYVMNRDGSNLIPLTFDAATDSAPVWGMDGEYIFFNSDRTGVPNIFAYALQEKTLHQVTNVLTGVFNPAANPNGMQLVFEKYSGNGMDIHVADLTRAMWKETVYSLEQKPESLQYAVADSSSVKEQRYNPFPSLLPKLWLPTLGIDEESYQVGIMTVGRDILGQHRYFFSAGYGIESERAGFSAEYTNEQFYPSITLFGSDLANVFVDIFQERNEKDADYWQREQVAGVEISFPLYLSQNTDLFLATGYRYKHIESLTDLTTLTPRPDEGVLSGFSVGMLFQHLNSSIYAISPESGILTAVSYRHDDRELGSDFTLDTVVGDTRIYFPAPALKHHVLALRAVGGASDGDTLEQGIFQLGGYWIESSATALDEQSFFLRGYENNALSGNRFALGSAEYRFPLWYPQRGIGKGWVFFDSFTGALFYDIGNAWDAETDIEDFKQGVGGELRINFGLQHGALPLTTRIGYAYGLDDDIGESQFILAVTFDFWL